MASARKLTGMSVRRVASVQKAVRRISLEPGRTNRKDVAKFAKANKSRIKKYAKELFDGRSS